MNIDPWATLRLEAKARWGRPTPYRLGRLVSECIVQLENPFEAGSNAHGQFARGLRDGHCAEVRL